MIGASPSLKSTQPSQSNKRAANWLTLPPRRLVTLRRYDLAVKHRYFRHLLFGSDPDAERVYLLMQDKRSGARMRMNMATDTWKVRLDDFCLPVGSNQHGNISGLESIGVAICVFLRAVADKTQYFIGNRFCD